MSRREVLELFKKLHRTRKNVFCNDDIALESSRQEINKAFKKNKLESDSYAIQKMLKLAADVDKELRTNVIQARHKCDGVYELRITPETTRLDNVVFNVDALIKSPDKELNKYSNKFSLESDDCTDASPQKNYK